MNSSTKSKLTPAEASHILQSGLGYHRAGRLAEARRSYEQILHAMPDHPDALHLLGLLARQEKNYGQAATLITRALSFNPVAPLYFNLGNVYQDMGRFADAAASYQQALMLNPDHVDALHNLGNAYWRQGRLEDAADCFQKAIRFRPDFAEAYSNLGEVLREQGNLDVALSAVDQALVLRPDFSTAYFNRGSILQALGKRGEAKLCFEQALALAPEHQDSLVSLAELHRTEGELERAESLLVRALASRPDHAVALNSLGVVCWLQDRPDEAGDCFLKAIAIQPDLAEPYSNLGEMLVKNGQGDEAVEYARKAIDLKPGMAAPHVVLGNALEWLGRNDEALACFRQALALAPESAEFHVRAAKVCEAQGMFAEAKRYAEQAVSLAPEHIGAWAVFPYLGKMTECDSDWCDKALELVAKVKTPEEEENICFALGKYFDDVKDYGRAFPFFARANQAQLHSHVPFDRKAFSDSISSIIADGGVIQTQDSIPADGRPVFIVGMPRSGTSLMEQILASHPEVYGAGELQYWGSQARRLGGLRGEQIRGEGVVSGLAAGYVKEMDARSDGELRVVDKMPANFLYLGAMLAAFPDAHVIHMMRSPIDTCLSIYFQHFNSFHTYANDLEDLAYYYKEYQRLMSHWRSVLPEGRFFEVPYEQLVDDQEAWARRVIDFIGLPWNDACLRFHETERRVGTASNWQVRQKVYKTSKERWRNYERHIAPLLALQPAP